MAAVAGGADLGSSRPGRTLARWCVVLVIAVVAFALGYMKAALQMSERGI